MSSCLNRSYLKHYSHICHVSLQNNTLLAERGGVGSSDLLTDLYVICVFYIYIYIFIYIYIPLHVAEN